MRSRREDHNAPPFLDEKTARKQVERQLLQDALGGALQAEVIEWTTATAIAIDPSLLASPRIQLRPWTDADREPFAAMVADPEVMRHFPSTWTREESDAWVDRTMRRMGERGWGFWALDHLADPASAPTFAGFTGLNIPEPELPFGPCVEVGWRLAPPFWGLGLATEAARLAVRAGFEVVGLEEIVAVTTLHNAPSQAVMRRLGMLESAADEFDHPAFATDSPERRCCVYRLSRARWSANQLASN